MPSKTFSFTFLPFRLWKNVVFSNYLSQLQLCPGKETYAIRITACLGRSRSLASAGQSSQVKKLEFLEAILLRSNKPPKRPPNKTHSWSWSSGRVSVAMCVCSHIGKLKACWDVSKCVWGKRCPSCFLYQYVLSEYHNNNPFCICQAQWWFMFVY